MSYSKWCCYETEILILDGAIRETGSAKDEISGADQKNTQFEFGDCRIIFFLGFLSASRILPSSEALFFVLAIR